ncbi:DNA mismatch repair protein Msh6-like [Liolophura sinensis]|uniref:DNA mismatch repair protein Msh6-like n=1 Tax=Liolophura sinensis TaxID=3198878 RepID=UPI003157FF4A
MSKVNTLFSYFNKSPVAQKKKDATPKPDVLTPKRSPNSAKNGKKSPPKKVSKIENVIDNKVHHQLDGVSLFDVVWAKLEGYPWWPSLVCNHPTQGTCKKGGKSPQVHVQFFDDPPSRAWVKSKFVKPFAGSDDKQCKQGGQFFTWDKKCQKAATEADKAQSMSVADRENLVVVLDPSDDEDGEGMEMTMSDEELLAAADNSKENSMNLSVISAGGPESAEKNRRRTRQRNGKPAKRRRIVVAADSDESGDEFKPPSDDDSESDSGSSGVDENEVSSPESASEVDSPVKVNSRKRKRSAGTKSEKKSSQESLESFSASSTPRRNTNCSPSFTPTVGAKTKSKLASFSAPEMSSSPEGETTTVFKHLQLEFLKPDKIRDKDRRLRTDPEYDPRTLYIPDSFLKDTTPAMRQWWEIKRAHFDTVLFFKMGKFYELFHMDAAIAVNELGLIYMKGDYAHSGFPEIAYGRYADTLIQKGYKVARIEQTETPEMMAERCKTSVKTTKFDKVVKREICRITSKGTKTFSFIDGDTSEAQNNYLLAVAEKEASQNGLSLFGVCFVDTSIGTVHIGQFSDDRYSSRLRTLIAHYTPVQILFERGKMTSRTHQVLNSNLTSVIKEGLTSGTEFWDSSKTLKKLAEADYFTEEGHTGVKWPGVVQEMISETDSLGLSPADGCDLALKALGAITWYLQYSLMDDEVLSMKKFEKYIPVDAAEKVEDSVADFTKGRQHMVIDGVTLTNLDIVDLGSERGQEGTLSQQLDRCSTPFGKRLFRQWLCAPLCNPKSINDRLDAVEDLIGRQEVVVEATEILKKLPDLERLLSKIHSLGLPMKGKNHPESRAILYEEVTYSKRKIEDFLCTLSGFKAVLSMVKLFKAHTDKFKSKLLRKTVTIAKGENPEACFPDIQEELAAFDEAFDHNKAKKDGVIIPTSGVDEEYDSAKSKIKATEKELDAYLSQQRQRLGCQSVTYWGSAKNRYQMEIPENVAKKVPDEYELTSSKKGWKRYRTKWIEELLAELSDAEDKKDAALKDVMRRIFHKFDQGYTIWERAVQCVAVLDVLISLANYSHCGDGPLCRPEVVSPGKGTKPFLEIREARHPCVTRTFGGGDFIPNDTVIGIADENEMDTDAGDGESSVVLVTGPNMGGKSTLMRQVGLITVIAQMGCYVPAEKCLLTPVDRIFTRLGASDRIMSGESTFFVELSETSAILQHASPHSLVLVDELGRGTATYDGTAIACAVVHELSLKTQCRTLFSTHYHSLVEEFSHDPNIRLGHMACMVENENDEDPSQETITFLYKFVKGACPKSYGFNAARLANLPEEIIQVSQRKAKEFEQSVDNLRLLRSVWKTREKSQLSSLQSQIRVS